MSVSQQSVRGKGRWWQFRTRWSQLLLRCPSVNRTDGIKRVDETFFKLNQSISYIFIFVLSHIIPVLFLHLMQRWIMRSKLVGATSNGIKRNERRERKTAGLFRWRCGWRESRWENFVAHSLVAWFNDLLKWGRLDCISKGNEGP